MNYDEALNYLLGISIFGIKPGLDRIKILLDKLNSPQNAYRAVHIAGTNGKGSTASMTAAMLQAAGLRTGLFISPHLTYFTERIQIDGEPISGDDFAFFIEKVKDAAEDMTDDAPTQFEVLTAAAFLCFAEKKTEYVVIEAGLGGLLDSTNIISPAVSIITNVSMDHAERCGGSLDGIARHKAGIIKEGVPVVTAAKGDPLKIIRRAAAGKNAELFVLGEDFAVRFVGTDGNTQKISFTANRPSAKNFSYELSLLGMNQAENSALAVVAAILLAQNDSRITDESLLAIRSAKWAGRFEKFASAAGEILLDGAHNEAGMIALRENLDFYFREKQRVFVLGILRDKETEAMLKALLRPEDTVITTIVPDTARAERAEDLAKSAAKYADNVFSCRDYRAALNKAVYVAADEELVVVTGSLYLVGAVRGLSSESAR